MIEPKQATMDQAPSTPHWKKAFPDFDGMTFDIPEGFEDSSWRNDACPSFVNGELGVQLYANYADPALREVPGARRFALLETDEGSSLSGGEVLADTDDFAEVLAAIDDRRAAKAPKVG